MVAVEMARKVKVMGFYDWLNGSMKQKNQRQLLGFSLSEWKDGAPIDGDEEG